MKLKAVYVLGIGGKGEFDAHENGGQLALDRVPH